jgi:hypothetical protein
MLVVTDKIQQQFTRGEIGGNIFLIKDKLYQSNFSCSIKVTIIEIMKGTEYISPDKQIYYRLIALWVLCEAIAGGMMHAVKIPFTGMIISSGAVICICLIAYYVPAKGAILKATIIVAVFKMLLSPHTPPTAYMAVFFQGLMGQLLFFNIRYHRLSCILLAVFALVESAIQRIVVLTVLYGTNFWSAVNEFLKKISNQSAVTDYSLFIATAYIALHAIAGLVVGLFAGSIVWQSKSWNILHEEYLIPDVNTKTNTTTKPGNSKRKMKLVFISIWFILMTLFIQSYFRIGTPILPADFTLRILLRSILIVLTWYFFLSPALSFFIKKWLTRQQIKSESDINQITLMLPSVQNLLMKSWELSAKEKGVSRLSMCSKIILMNTLKNRDDVTQVN